MSWHLPPPFAFVREAGVQSGPAISAPQLDYRCGAPRRTVARGVTVLKPAAEVDIAPDATAIKLHTANREGWCRIGSESNVSLPDRPVLLYDDDCRFCRATVEVVRRWDRRGRMALLPWSDPLAERWMIPLPPDLRERSMHVKRPDGALISSGDAFVAVLSVLPGFRWLAALAGRSEAARGGLTRLYDVVAANRGPLSRLVPNRPAPVRRPRVE